MGREREIREGGRKKREWGYNKETPSLNVLKHYMISQEGKQQRGKERKEREKWRENEGGEVGGEGKEARKWQTNLISPSPPVSPTHDHNCYSLTSVASHSCNSFQ